MTDTFLCQSVDFCSLRTWEILGSVKYYWTFPVIVWMLFKCNCMKIWSLCWSCSYFVVSFQEETTENRSCWWRHDVSLQPQPVWTWWTWSGNILFLLMSASVCPEISGGFWKHQTLNKDGGVKVWTEAVLWLAACYWQVKPAASWTLRCDWSLDLLFVSLW